MWKRFAGRQKAWHEKRANMKDNARIGVGAKGRTDFFSLLWPCCSDIGCRKCG